MNPKDDLFKWKIQKYPNCEKCGNPATVVRYITPLIHGGSEFCQENLISLCDNCDKYKQMLDKHKYSANDDFGL